MASLSLTVYPKKPGKVWANSPREAALGQLVTEHRGITLYSEFSRPELKSLALGTSRVMWDSPLYASNTTG